MTRYAHAGDLGKTAFQLIRGSNSSMYVTQAAAQTWKKKVQETMATLGSQSVRLHRFCSVIPREV